MAPVATTPIPAQISIAPTVTTNSPQGDQGSNDKSTAADWWGVGLTAVMAVATIALVLIARRQFRQQTDDTAEALRLTREANAANQNSATENARLTREAMLLAHRPKLIVKDILIEGATTLFNAGSPPSTENDAEAALKPVLAKITHLTAKFSVRNVGNQRATIQFVSGIVHVGQMLPDVNPAIGKGLSVQLPDPFMPGTNEELLTHPCPVNQAALFGIRNRSLTIFVVGKVIYRDEMGYIRRTGFARRYDMTIGRFRALESDPDYEYEE